jgi:hypothetical protein
MRLVNLSQTLRLGWGQTKVFHYAIDKVRRFGAFPFKLLQPTRAFRCIFLRITELLRQFVKIEPQPAALVLDGPSEFASHD